MGKYKNIKIEDFLNELNKLYNLKIENSQIYKRAFAHSSYTNEKNIEKYLNYERLEFLGDAVLELITSEFLYKKFPTLPEGDLTKLRASIVCEPTLVKIAKELNFHNYIYLGKGEEKTGGRERPALLADIFESFIGALYLEKGIETVKLFLNSTLYLTVKDYKYSSFIDYKTILQEYVSKEKLGDINYKVLDSTGPSHSKMFLSAVYINNEIFGNGSSKTKKESEQLAAKEALNKFKVIN